MFRGVNNGGWDPNEHNFNLYTIVIGSQALHAVGYAMGVQRDGADSAVIAYFGDGASSQGDVHESFVFAASYNAPVVFFCQNNQWAISEPDRAADPGPAVPARRRLRLPRGPGGRQRRLRLPRGDPGGARARPHRQRPDADRGLHLPDGRAHHLRRPDAVPVERRGRGLARQGPDRAAARPTCGREGQADEEFFAGRRRGGRRSPRRSAPTAWRCPTPSR